MAEYAQRQPLENNLASIKRVLWDSPVSNLTRRANERNPQYRFEDYSFKIDSINIDLLFAYFKNLYSEISDCTIISCGSPIWYSTSDYPDNIFNTILPACCFYTVNGGVGTYSIGIIFPCPLTGWLYDL